MAVSNNYEIKNYTLDGIATQFAIPFDVNVDDYGNAINIVVYLGLTELTKDVDYTISVKTINYPDAVSHTGEKLTVFRRTPIEQPVDFVDNGNFTLEDIETGLDRSIMIEQETAANLDNTIKAQESAELAEQYKDIAIEKASDAEDWAVGTRSDGETPSHSLESAKHWAEAADTSASQATSMRNQSAASALVSEGWAKGTQSGTPVDNTSPYYQANSKYYKEQAGLSAGAASGSATSAYNSELAAAASETMAEKWAENPIDTEVETGRYSAKHWAAKSSVSAGAASVSAYNAGLSETAADTSAKDSEAWAVGQRGGSDVDPSDPTYHNNAKWYNDNIAAQTVTPDNTVTLTNKTISYDDNTLPGVVGESATQTLTNKTIDRKDNTVTCSPTTVSEDTTLNCTKEMNVVIDTASVTLTLGTAPYTGYMLPVVATASCTVAYNSTTDTLSAGQRATYTWNGSAWVSDHIQTDTYTWENTSLKAVGTFKKKGNVVMVNIDLTAKASLTANSTITLTGTDFPTGLLPLYYVQQILYTGVTACRAIVMDSGNFSFVPYVNSVASSTTMSYAITYMTAE